ncbi:MAG: GntR family transcriptional regulator [Sulfitobacter sp.]
MPQETDTYDVLKKRLTSNGFKHGAKLRPEELRTELGCSTSTVREILFRLSTVGLVNYQDQRGFRVPERNPEKMIELTNMRILLEAEGAALSIRNGGIAWEAQLTAAHHKLMHVEGRIREQTDRSTLGDIWMTCEAEFHQTLISACASKTLKVMHAQIYAQFRQQLMVTDVLYEFISENIKDHAAILDAALSGDETNTRGRVYDHLKRHLTGKTLGI